MTETRATDPEASRPAAGEIDVPWNLVVPEVDLHLVGYGNRFPNDFTLEMLAVLRHCKRIFGAPPLHAPDFGMPPMEGLMHLYSPGRPRKQTYAEMVDIVLAAAAADPPVAFATYGSVMVGTTAGHRLLEEARRRALTVHVSNAASSFDGIWADFNIEPFCGFEVWEASTFMRLAIEPNTRANLLLPQAPIFDVAEGLDPGTMSIRTSTGVAVLRDYLLRFYPPSHIVHYAKTGSGADSHHMRAEIESFPLSDLDNPGVQQISTLFVPRLAWAGQGKLDFDSPALQGAQSHGQHHR
ncbi:SAM-dependent methyltransferase [Spirillospora sp. NPDC052269]